MKKLLVLWFVGLLLIASPSHAVELTELDRSDIAKMEKYLNGIKTMAANITQTLGFTGDAPGTNYSFGKFFLSRPGKIRWEYTLPDPVVIVVDEKKLTYYDQQLDQISHSSIDSNLSTLLMKPDIRFEGSDIEVVKIERDKGGIAITVQEKAAKEEDGYKEQLTLTFSYTPVYTLKRMTVMDATGKITNIELSNHMYGLDLNKDLFVIKDPRVFGPKKNN